jgi:hypothetical protein
MTDVLDSSARQNIVDDGYTVLRNAVPRDLVDEALHAVNASLGQRGIDPAMLDKYRATTYCPELTEAAPITDLLRRTAAWDAGQELIGRDRVRAPGPAQIGLRFPLPPGSGPFPLQPHIDGMHAPENDVPMGHIFRFTMLVAVMLSDVESDDAGNFTVWPGSHVAYAEHFHQHGTTVLAQGRMPNLRLRRPVQVRARAGDAVVAHYGLGHCVAPNLSPNIRYAVFFRLRHVEHDDADPSPMHDLWREWEGVAAHV